MKKCSKCGEVKSLEEFSKDKAKKDGLDSRCKVCRKQYRKANREKLAEQKKQYYEANREKFAERHKQHYQANRELYNAYEQKRRALKRNAAGNATAADIRARFDYHGNRCYYCGSEENLEIEHRIPLSRGGTHYPANIVPACKSCNCSKATKTEKEFKFTR